MIWDTSIWRLESSNHSTIRSDQKRSYVAGTFCYSAKCSYKMIPGSSADTFQEYSFAVDSKPSHSVYECSSAGTQSDCSAIRTAYAALARGKRLYDFLALLPFVLLGAGVDIRS